MKRPEKSFKEKRIAELVDFLSGHFRIVKFRLETLVPEVLEARDLLPTTLNDLFAYYPDIGRRTGPNEASLARAFIELAPVKEKIQTDVFAQAMAAKLGWDESVVGEGIKKAWEELQITVIKSSDLRDLKTAHKIRLAADLEQYFSTATPSP